MGKLVRDRVPDIIRESGRSAACGYACPRLPIVAR